MDVICVWDKNQRPFCTDFHIRFLSRYVDEATVSILGVNDVPSLDVSHPVFPVSDGTYISDSAVKSHLYGQTLQRNDHVQISVNGYNVPEVKAFIGEEQFLYFYDVESGQHSRTPSSAVLKKFELKMGKNNVTCIHFGSNLFREFNIWRLERTDNLIVMDIDGTITKSDITGYIQTVYMGLFSHVHDGIVPFLNTLKERYNCTIVYLTARPLIHQKETRLLLEGIQDADGNTMPDGPLFPSKDKLLAALYREVISKTTVQMKSAVLVEINRVFRRAGCERITPFVLGVGNKEGDAFAYNLAGLSAEHILLIDKSSKIVVWKHKQLQAMKHSHSVQETTLHRRSTHGGSGKESGMESKPVGVPMVEAVSLSGAEKFAVKDETEGDVIATVTSSGEFLDPMRCEGDSRTFITSKGPSESDKSKSPHSSVKLTGDISVTDHDYFGVTSSPVDSPAHCAMDTSHSNGDSHMDYVDSASTSFPPAEKRGIWGFMKRSSTVSNVDGLQSPSYTNAHAYHSYNDRRLMDYIHHLSAKF